MCSTNQTERTPRLNDPCSFTEQELDARELPAQLAQQPCEPGFTTMFFLRSHAFAKAVRDGKGLVRVFVSDDLRGSTPSSALSKTLLAMMGMHVPSGGLRVRSCLMHRHHCGRCHCPGSSEVWH